VGQSVSSRRHHESTCDDSAHSLDGRDRVRRRTAAAFARGARAPCPLPGSTSGGGPAEGGGSDPSCRRRPPSPIDSGRRPRWRHRGVLPRALDGCDGVVRGGGPQGGKKFRTSRKGRRRPQNRLSGGIGQRRGHAVASPAQPTRGRTDPARLGRAGPRISRIHCDWLRESFV